MGPCTLSGGEVIAKKPGGLLGLRRGGSPVSTIPSSIYPATTLPSQPAIPTSQKIWNMSQTSLPGPNNLAHCKNMICTHR
jgi:hypothetical protein